MNRSRVRAFSLVELLMVVTIIGVLVALLMPAFSMARHAVDQSMCRTNLSALFKAQSLWLAERDASSTGSVGEGWAGSIAPYLEGGMSSLRCPACPRIAQSSGTSSSGGDGGSDGGGGDTGTGSGNVPPGIDVSDLTIGVLRKDNSEVLYEIPLSDSPYWTMYETWDMPDGQRYIAANTDGYMVTATQTHAPSNQTKGANAYFNPPLPSGSSSNTVYVDGDFIFTVEYSHGQPVRVTVKECDNNEPVVIVGGTKIQAKYDMRIRHQPIWGGETFTSPFAKGHVDAPIDLREEAQKNGTLVDYTTTWTPWSNSLGVLAATNYGVNRGAYTTQDGSDAPNPDPKQFFILDYPKPVADYANVNDKPGDTDLWPRIFINPAPPERWSPLPGLETWTWQEVQALRHFGKANGLFCDGHIEALGPEDLSATNPLWRNRK